MSDLKLDQSTKFDGGKPRWDLLPLKALSGIVKVLTFGASKYKDNGWKDVHPDRYKAALFRHLHAMECGKTFDSESGLPHIYHAACNVIFLVWFWEKENENVENNC